MDGRLPIPSPTVSDADTEAPPPRRHGVGAAWLAVCLAHDAFQEGDVEWLMEIAARRRGDVPGEDA